MKKLILLFLVCLTLIGFFVYGPGRNIPASNGAGKCQLYFVDKQLHCLVPTAFSADTTPEKTAKKMVAELLSGRDKNTAILRIIPNVRDGITVRTSGETAYVNISSELSKDINRNAENEKLFIYQIVNSLTSVEGIQYVRFTIDGEVRQDFLGFLDMREIFAPNYRV